MSLRECGCLSVSGAVYTGKSQKFLPGEDSLARCGGEMLEDGGDADVGVRHLEYLSYMYVLGDLMTAAGRSISGLRCSGGDKLI
jgi:hypothetical protein